MVVAVVIAFSQFPHDCDSKKAAAEARMSGRDESQVQLYISALGEIFSSLSLVYQCLTGNWGSFWAFNAAASVVSALK